MTLDNRVRKRAESTQLPMKTTIAIASLALSVTTLSSAQQETKPVPKDSVRLSIPGCTRGYMFTAGARTTDEPGAFEIPEGMHLRMNGPKKLMGEIKAHEGSRVEITGIMKKGQYKEGVAVGGGVRIMPGQAPNTGGAPAISTAGPMQIDVEGWRQLDGGCPTP
jgi:hypothetical protein